MSRFVRPARAGDEGLESAPGLPPTEPGDGYAARVAKYVPAEIVAAYVAILAVLDPAAPDATAHTLCIVAFVALLVATPLYLLLLGRPGDRAPAVQVTVSTAAFAVWAYALRGVSCAFPAVPFDGRVAFVALALFTVASGLARPAPVPAGPPRVPPVSAAPPAP